MVSRLFKWTTHLHFIYILQLQICTICLASEEVVGPVCLLAAGEDWALPPAWHNIATSPAQSLARLHWQ